MLGSKWACISSRLACELAFLWVSMLLNARAPSIDRPRGSTLGATFMCPPHTPRAMVGGEPQAAKAVRCWGSWPWAGFGGGLTRARLYVPELVLFSGIEIEHLGFAIVSPSGCAMNEADLGG